MYIAVGDPVQEGRVGIPSPHICACPKPGTGFPMSYVIVVFVFSELGWEVIAHFVDIGGIGPSLSFYSRNIFL